MLWVENGSTRRNVRGQAGYGARDSPGADLAGTFEETKNSARAASPGRFGALRMRAGRAGLLALFSVCGGQEGFGLA